MLRRAMAGFEGRAVAVADPRRASSSGWTRSRRRPATFLRNRAQSEMRHFLRMVPRLRHRTDDRARSRAPGRPRNAARPSTHRRGIKVAYRRDRRRLGLVLGSDARAAAHRNVEGTRRPRRCRRETWTSMPRGRSRSGPRSARPRQGRTVPMNDALVDMLRERLRGLKRDGFVFGEGSGFPSGRSRASSKAFARLWTTMPAEAERWTPCTIFAERSRPDCTSPGVDALVIEDLLGHLTGVRGGIAGVYNAATTLDRQRLGRLSRAGDATLAAFGDARSRS